MEPARDPGKRRTRAPVLLAVCIAFLAHWILGMRLSYPGLWDPFWYADVARHLARGEGLTSSIVWNYACVPADLIHPAGEYWLPGAAWVASLGYGHGGDSLTGARAVMGMLGILLIAVGYLTAWAVLGPGHQRSASFVALALALSVPLTYFGVTIDTPLPFAVATSLALLLLGLSGRRPWLAVAAVPCAIGAQLTRADGILVTALVLVWCAGLVWRKRASWSVAVVSVVLTLALWVPWLCRNARVYGTPFPSSMLEGAALCDYSDLFRVHSRPSLGRFLTQAPLKLLASKGRALVANVALAFDAQTLPLLPLALLGLPLIVASDVLAPHLIYALLLYLAMSLVFNFQSQNGSLVHSLPALYPVYFLAVAAGLERIVRRLDPSPAPTPAPPPAPPRSATGAQSRRRFPILARWAPRLVLLWLGLHLWGLVLRQNAFTLVNTDMHHLADALNLWRSTQGGGGGRQARHG